MKTFQAILISAVSGIAGTTFGGVLTAFLPVSEKTTAKLFSLSGGMMLGLALSHLMPEASEASPCFALIGALGGFVILLAVDSLLKDQNDIRTHKGRSNKKIDYLSLLIFAAIALHNVPEGIAIGAGASTDIGTITAIAIGAHNIPEGMSIAIPIVADGKSKIKGVLGSMLGGTPTLAGGIVGAVLCGRYSSLLPLSLGVAAGAMIAVTIFELFDRGIDPYMTSIGVGLSLSLSLL